MFLFWSGEEGRRASECADGRECRGTLGGCEQHPCRWCQSCAILVADDFDQVPWKPSAAPGRVWGFLIPPTRVAAPRPLRHGFLGNPIPAISQDLGPASSRPEPLRPLQLPSPPAPLLWPGLPSEYLRCHQNFHTSTKSLGAPCSFHGLLPAPCCGSETRPQSLRRSGHGEDESVLLPLNLARSLFPTIGDG